MNVDVGATLPGVTLIGPRGRGRRPRACPGRHRVCSARAPLERRQLQLELCSMFGFAPAGEYSKNNIGKYQPPSLGDHAEARSHLFQPKTGWQVNGAVVYGAPTFLYW